MKRETKKAEEAELSKKRLIRLEQFRALCPEGMLETDINLLPKKQYCKVMAWNSCKRGLVLHGEPRLGKTRCLWMLLKRLMVEEGKRFMFLMLYDSESILEKMKKADFREDLLKIPYLALDDLGKEKSNNAMETMLFNLISQRVDNKKPVLITTNFIGHLLEDRFFDPIKAQGIIGRIREFCDSVAFAREEK